MAAQSAQIGVAEAALYPTLAINGIIGWDAADFSKFFETKSFIGAVFPSFTWNILNYGRIKNNVRLQMAKTQELIATYQNTVLTAGREVQTPLRGFLRSREQADDLDRSVKAATAATQLGVQQYRTGIIDFNRVFNLETTQVQQQDQLAVAAGNIALNLVSVYRALGGGWELRFHEDGHDGERCPDRRDRRIRAQAERLRPGLCRRLSPESMSRDRPRVERRREARGAGHDKPKDQAGGTRRCVGGPSARERGRYSSCADQLLAETVELRTRSRAIASNGCIRPAGGHRTARSPSPGGPSTASRRCASTTTAASRFPKCAGRPTRATTTSMGHRRSFDPVGRGFPDFSKSH